MERNETTKEKAQPGSDIIESPDRWVMIKNFLESIRHDPRITVFYMSIYLSLVYEWERRDFEQPLPVASHTILSHAKISSPATWHKCIRALHAWGFLEYIPSYSNVLGSMVRFRPKLIPQGKRDIAR